MVKKKGKPSIKADDFRAVCSAARTWYLANKKIPTLEEINSICSASRGTVAKILQTEEFLAAMDATGIPFRKSKGLTAHQHFTLMIMTDPNDKRPHHIRLKEAAVSTTMWRAWLRNPLFASFLETFMENALGDHMNAAHLSLMNQVDKGNTRALELYYAMTGRFSAHSQPERDLQAVLTGVIEIIQRNVSDPIALSNIAEQIGELMGRKKQLTAYRSEQVGSEQAEEVLDAEVLNSSILNSTVEDKLEYVYNVESTIERTVEPPVPQRMTFDEKRKFLEEGFGSPKQSLEFPDLDFK